MDNLTRQLAAFSASLTYQQIPPAILHHARRSLIDSIGCAFGGRDCKPSASPAASPRVRLRCTTPAPS
jgi:2-methylcitrate dehydratase PrpD